MTTQRHDEFECDPELAMAVRLMEQGVPENGIDLGPQWDRFLQEESRDAVERPRKSVAGRPSSLNSLVATILFSAVIGGAIVHSASGNRHTSQIPLMSGERHYTAEQKDLMFALLDATQSVPRETVRLASRELAGCMACHDGGLRNRLLAEIGP